MQLDYNPTTQAFILRVPRTNGADVQALMADHGLDFSTTASTPTTAVLFTHEPYAACAFEHVMTERARAELAPMLAQIRASWRLTSTANIRCPPDRQLWDVQKAAIEYALDRQHTLIGDQPGVGKTPTAICFANEIQAQNVLVVVPANIRIQWVRRIREWTTMRLPIIHPIMNAKNGVHPNANWTVVSYDLTRSEPIARALAAREYDLVILDEAHYLKSVDSLRTRAMFGGGEKIKVAPLAGRARRILALTGTPLPNRPREAYTLARGLCFDAIDFLSEENFRVRFNPSMKRERVDPKTGHVTVYIDERTGRHAELQSRLRSMFMVRRLKRDALPQLHLPVYDIIQLEETKAVKQALKAESLLEINPEDLSGADAAVLGHVAVVRRLMGVAMAPQVADYVDMLIDGGEEKLVVFGWHHEVLDILEARWRKHGVVRIDGRTSDKAKQCLVDQFIANPKVQICLGNMQSMGVGTDGLQAVAWHGLIAEPDWTPGNNIQVFARLDRGGQERKVQGDIFVAPGSFAERVLASALRKLQVTHKALDRRLGQC